MSAVIEGVSLPRDVESGTSSLANSQLAELQTTRVIVFMGDDITATVKYEMLSVRGWGGLDMQHIKTLPKANKGILYRCQLTPLRTSSIIENRAMLPPDKRDGGEWEKGFVQKNAIENADGTWSDKEVNGFQTSDPQSTKDGKFVTKLDGAHLFKRRYPGTDVKMAIRRSVPHGAGGVVEVAALKGATQEVIYAAQLFFFPEWGEIRKGAKSLPVTMRETEEHIKTRIAAIPLEVSPDKQNDYRSIGAAMLQSCTQFRIHYLATFQKNEIILKDSAVKGNTGAAFPESAEQAMAMLEYKRKDDLVSGESSSVDRLARIMEKKELGESESNSKMMLLEERKQYVAEVQGGFRDRDEDEEVRLGLKKTDKPVAAFAPEYAATVESVDGTPESQNVYLTPTPDGGGSFTVTVPEPQTETVTNGMKLCGKTKANGEPCERQIDALADFCFQHGPSE